MIMMLSSGGVPECLHADRVGGLMWSDDGAVRDGTLPRRDGVLPRGQPLSAIADSTRVQVTPKTTSLPRDLIIAG